MPRHGYAAQLGDFARQYDGDDNGEEVVQRMRESL
jgi:hypothetical protein